GAAPPPPPGVVPAHWQEAFGAGRVENAQVAVYLVYAAALGHAAIDRALYVPRSWTEAPDRCRSAGIPDGLAFATKPRLATRIVERALDAGAPARWVAGDEVYGDNPHLRTAGKFQAKTLAARIPKRAWQRLSAGAGAKGERYYDRAQIDIHDAAGRPGQWCLLARRNRRTGELAFYHCFSPRPVPMSELVRVAGRRWRIEETFQASKGLTGLDEHQVRRWASWHRWATLAMLAHAFVACTAATERRDRPAPDGLIPMTGNEIQHLFAAWILPAHDLTHRLRRSHRRRRHQARARRCHYRHQAAVQP
ncbi:transposase, partial [Streptomyces lasiicapitis]|uniref:transposase n=1 Tax=Streptomyces lasiicapitis TaxID=1923961 RepID=UPI0036BB696F